MITTTEIYELLRLQLYRVVVDFQISPDINTKQ
jgi:hypothetical protein